MTNAEELVHAIMDYHGFESGQELKNSKLFQEAREKAGTAAGALRELSRVEHENITLNGWYLRTREFTDWNEEQETMEVTANGPVVLLEDGDVRSFANDQELNGLDPLDPVQIGPLTRRDNIETGESRIVTPSGEIKVQPVEHEEPLPSITLDGVLNHCNSIDDGRNSRGVINGESGDYPRPATLTIGGPDDIDWFRPGVSDFSPEGTLRVRASDENGNAVAIKLPIDKTQRLFGLADEDPQGAYQDALEGERIFAMGQVSVLYPRSRDNVADPGAFDQFINELDNQGFLTNYRTWNHDDGTESRLQALDLTGHRDEEGEPIKAIYAEDLGLRVFDAREERPGEWMLYVHADDINKDPWMNCKETNYERDDGTIWTSNPGAFVKFLSKSGMTDENDPYAQGAEMLGLDDEPTTADSQPNATTQETSTDAF